MGHSLSRICLVPDLIPWENTRLWLYYYQTGLGIGVAWSGSKTGLWFCVLLIEIILRYWNSAPVNSILLHTIRALFCFSSPNRPIWLTGDSTEQDAFLLPHQSTICEHNLGGEKNILTMLTLELVTAHFPLHIMIFSRTFQHKLGKFLTICRNILLIFEA